MSLEGTRVLVLGAAGFIGRWVARVATARGARLVLAVRDRDTAEPILERWGARGEIVVCDLADPVGVASLVRVTQPDVMLNLAGYGVDRVERDETLAHRINAELVESLALACARLPRSEWAGTRLVHVGSALEYGATGGELVEDSPCTPTTLYGQSKLAGTLALERQAKSLDLPVITARLFTIFGPGEHQNRLFPSLVEAARAGRELPLTDGAQRRDFAYVEDVAELLVDLAGCHAAPGAIVNVASGRMQPVRHFIEETARQLGIERSRLAFGALPTRPEEQGNVGVSVERLRGLLGRVPGGELGPLVERAIGGWRMLWPEHEPSRR